MVTELSFVCLWQLQVYPLKNARSFFHFLAALNFSYCCLFYGLSKLAKNGYFANFKTLGFRCY